MIEVKGVSSLKIRGVPEAAKKKLRLLNNKQSLALLEPLTFEELTAWTVANPQFACEIQSLSDLANQAAPFAMADTADDEIPVSRLSQLLARLSATPSIWLPRTNGGHTRQYFPIHESGIVTTTGSAVFDTFAVVGKNQPLFFSWRDVDLEEQEMADLRLILGRMTYFGRAESWCHAEAFATDPPSMPAVVIEGSLRTHWECICLESSRKPEGVEYRDYTLERRLAATEDLRTETIQLLPLTKPGRGKKRDVDEAGFRKVLESETASRLLLRCVLRESGQDIKDGLERPVGTRWVHYAVPRAVFDVPRPQVRRPTDRREMVNLVRYALNTATVGRPVLPAVTDTVLVADRFRSAALALCRVPSRSLSGHEQSGRPCQDNSHAYWWPIDEDRDGFIDHVFVWAPAGFEQSAVDALRRLTRLRQRGGRPDLLVTPVFVGKDSEYHDWQACRRKDAKPAATRTFISATPYFCPVHLTHGRSASGKVRPLVPRIRKGLRIQRVIEDDCEVEAISEIVFDYTPTDLARTLKQLRDREIAEPVAPRQFFPALEAPTEYPPLVRFGCPDEEQFRGAFLKDPDAGYPLGLSIGMLVDQGSRFIRAMSFGRRRRQLQVRGQGRMLVIRFLDERPPRPFAIGDQCHFGLGLFVPVRAGESRTA
ncbi:MAG: hypothetical protein IPM24_14060 [Bryobacterales bacterium]|nr:hypothetical protein [Bryobacterales bacterium]